MRDILYRRVKTGDGNQLHDVGIFRDGTLYNPNGYPEDTVREAVREANERRHARRSEAAKRAATTRRRRQEKRVYDVAARIVQGHVFGPASHCAICRKGLADPQSIERAIGSDCWQGVLDAIQTDALTIDMGGRS